MKANELMLGDWINLHFDFDYKTGTPIYGYVQVTGINRDGTIDVNCIYDKSESMQDGWDLKLIEPIELTEEILKKNGFEHETNVGFIYEDYSTSNTIIVDRWNNTLKVLHNYDVAYCYTYYRPINVHELQHLLRILEIDKEIVI